MTKMPANFRLSIQAAPAFILRACRAGNEGGAVRSMPVSAFVGGAAGVPATTRRPPSVLRRPPAAARLAA